MAHGQGSEQVVMVDDLSLPSSKWSLLKADPQIKQTQNNLQILISVLLTLSVIGTILTIVDSLAGYDRNISLRVASMVRPLLALILHGFGFSVTYRYNELGLLAFAWLILIGLFLLGMRLEFLLVSLIVSAFSSTGEDARYRLVSTGESIASFFAALIYVVVFILTIIVPILAFKLAKLIRMKKSETMTPS
ncbi:unnamed protein product [Rotaria socialis]|uniref:Uncharacterized protein n=1 Tax=Rotaria socialis TaxID=392032 RepID=A0A818U6U0_9BILA|nr:unnamed protein product [Rotaria socialis]CAF3528464.1 unnamed protein product [Rotaria socialis]CAF3691869.1 unnamed protein product [Rotaria socialis]